MRSSSRSQKEPRSRRRPSPPASRRLHVRRARTAEVIATVEDVQVQLQGWVDLRPPALDLDAGDLGRLIAALHRVEFTGAVGTDPWYEAPVGEDRWRAIIRELRAAGAPFTDELEALVPELVALEAFLGAPPRSLRTCHRDLWADNLRGTSSGSLCVFDFDNAGLADPSQELALILVEFGGDDGTRSRAIQSAYADAGGPGPRRGSAGLRHADRPARAHRRGGLPALACRDDRRRACLE